MDYSENASMRGSHLRPPSRITAPGMGLHEMSASDNNARTGGASSMMPPPMKHKPSGLPEPATKRKTLVERAGESTQSNPIALPTSRSVNSAVTNTAQAGPRNTSFSSSISSSSSRNPSTTSRTTSASSTRSVVGSIGRSAGNHLRSRTAMPNNRAVHSSTNGTTRPATAIGDHETSVSDHPVLGKRKAWDTKGRLEDMESLYAQLKGQMDSTTFERNGLEETVNLYKTRHDTKVMLSTTNTALDDSRRAHTHEVDDLTRKHRNEIEDSSDRHRKDRERLRKEAQEELDGLGKEHREEIDKLIRQHKDDLNELENRLKAEIEEQRSQRLKVVQDLSTQIALQQQSTDINISNKNREAQTIREDLSRTASELEQERALNDSLKKKLAEADANNIAIDTSMRTMKAKIDFLESDNQAQSQAFADLNQKLQDAINSANEAQEKLRVEETLRRKLHNQVQELKGNIRVFCRVRPTLDDTEAEAKMTFPDAESDGREVQVQGPEQKSALGKITTATNSFAFDKVFDPTSTNATVFEEISQLVQSALDGYNVCIFCYGQTGSGKTFTMSSSDGMIPRTVAQIYSTAQRLEEKGWRYEMCGSFVEVYNETLNDLLGRADEFDRTDRHKITHDLARGSTELSGVHSVLLDGPQSVEDMLAQASRNRSVAATKANERSSRSHSVFILKLIGTNDATGEKSEGTLNLVDLAGSERLSQSGAEGARLKETQSINKSLSCLGDVIGALGQGKEGGHVPYRNSKLTYLLQQSLGGNSKTLMFVMISPLQLHLSETLTSLKFATKVHNTHIGTAKQQAKVKD
ncbi:kinesin motor domain-containing protein [Viridothelium virens]|uniref:Kinesin-like protein n=1 Tax=Viridothelium virens TaxID=1048519 RepID=A0A6A6H3W0_VIRVR|nr:kinesin motor domain-containing protein [Viridothelium virens]